MIIAFLSHVDINLYLFRLPVMKALVEDGHTVYAIAPQGDYFDKFKEHNITALHYEINRQSLNPFSELTTIKNIEKVIEPLNLDVLHNFTVKPNIYGSIAGKRQKVPTIINSITGLGSFFIQTTPKAKIVKFIIKLLYKYANKNASAVMFQNSDDLSYFVDENLLDLKKTVLIKGSGIDTSFFTPQEKPQYLLDELKCHNKTIVMMVARAIWDKGIKEFYHAAQNLASKDVIFILVGDTDEGNLSCADSKFLNTKNVTWLGHRTDIKDLTSLADIYVLPSYREGLPRTLLEAASMQKAIVTTDAVGCKEVVNDGENGFLVPIKDSNVLSKKIEILIHNTNLRNEFGKKSREKAINEFDIAIIVKKYLDVYKRF